MQTTEKTTDLVTKGAGRDTRASNTRPDSRRGRTPGNQAG